MLSVTLAVASARVAADKLLIDGQQSTYLGLEQELQAVIKLLAQKALHIQRQAAGILRGYLSTLNT